MHSRFYCSNWFVNHFRLLVKCFTIGLTKQKQRRAIVFLNEIEQPSVDRKSGATDVLQCSLIATIEFGECHMTLHHTKFIYSTKYCVLHM